MASSLVLPHTSKACPFRDANYNNHQLQQTREVSLGLRNSGKMLKLSPTSAPSYGNEAGAETEFKITVGFGSLLWKKLYALVAIHMKCFRPPKNTEQSFPTRYMGVLAPTHHPPLPPPTPQPLL